jgi:hypothetical protein
MQVRETPEYKTAQEFLAKTIPTPENIRREFNAPERITPQSLDAYVGAMQRAQTAKDAAEARAIEGQANRDFRQSLADQADATRRAIAAQSDATRRMGQELMGDRSQTAAVDRERNSFIKPYDKILADNDAQLDRINDAADMVNGTIVGQALAAPKVLTAILSGQGLGVRITKPEIDQILAARGIKGALEGWVNSISGKGKFGETQKNQLLGVLADVRARVEQKRAIAATVRSKMNSARSRDEIVAADQEAMDGIKELEQARSRGGSSGSMGEGAKQKPIIQQSPSTGAFRYSLDGGKTWLPGQPPSPK